MILSCVINRKHDKECGINQDSKWVHLKLKMLKLVALETLELDMMQF